MKKYIKDRVLINGYPLVRSNTNLCQTIKLIKRIVMSFNKVTREYFNKRKQSKSLFTHTYFL